MDSPDVAGTALMSRPLASILINNYNYGRFLDEAINSALSQNYPRKEIIVVDDGSTDNSREIISRYGDRIIPIFKENGGQASAVNAGVARCHGDILCFLDSTIFSGLIHPDKLERVAASVLPARHEFKADISMHPVTLIAPRRSCPKESESMYDGPAIRDGIASKLRAIFSSGQTSSARVSALLE